MLKYFIFALKTLLLLVLLLNTVYSKVILLEGDSEAEHIKKTSKVISFVKKGLIRRKLVVEIQKYDSKSLDTILSESPSDYFCRVRVEKQAKLYKILLVIRKHEQEISDTIKVTGKFKWAAQTLALKAENYFSESNLANLVISTSPDQARIEINKRFYGFSPAEIPMPAGKYNLIITKKKFAPVSEEISLGPGDEFDIKHELIEMPKGTSGHRRWLWTSAAFTTAALVSQLINDKLHDDYLSLNGSSSNDKFEQKYKNYQISNGIRNSLMAAAMVSLGVYVYFEW